MSRRKKTSPPEAAITVDAAEGRGRPTEFRPEYCDIARRLAEQGATDQELADVLRVHRSTFYRWLSDHPEFRDAIKLGKEPADERVVRSLYHRAVGYSYPAVKIMQNNGMPVTVNYTEHVPPDIGAATLWLTNRKGDEWRSRQSLEHSGPNGGAIPIAELKGDMTDDEAVEVYMRLVGGQ